MLIVSYNGVHEAKDPISGNVFLFDTEEELREFSVTFHMNPILAIFEYHNFNRDRWGFELCL